MSPKVDNSDSFELPDLWADLQDLEDGTITQEKLDALAALIDRSPAARRGYYEYFHQVAVIRMEAEQFSKKEKLAAIIPTPHVRSWWKPRICAVAALIIFTAVFSFLLINRPNISEKMSALATHGTVWEINNVQQDTNAYVKPGDTVRVLSGMIRMELASGSHLVMQESSQVSFPSFHKPVLDKGWLWIDTAQTEDAFEIKTPEILVRDIGTRFGVKVREDQPSEIHLHDGGVKVLSRESGISFATLAADGKGHQISGDGDRKEILLAEDPFPIIKNLLASQSDYSATLLAQNPISYLKFDSGVDGSYENEILGRRAAKSGPAITLHPAGVSEDLRFKGLDADNSSIYFPTNEHNNWSTSVIAFLDGDAGFTSKQGAVTFWIKQPEGAVKNQVLWLTGKVNPEKNALAGELIYAYLTPSGRMGLSLVDQSQSTSIEAEQLISNNLWHHVGITWSPKSISLYIDGKNAAHRDNVSYREDWVSNGNFVRFGKPTEDLIRNNITSFHGYFDEFALWNRPLSSEEIARQYAAALGMSGE